MFYELKELLSIFKKHKTNIERELLDDIIEVFCCASVLKYSRYGSVFNDDFNTCSINYRVVCQSSSRPHIAPLTLTGSLETCKLNCNPTVNLHSNVCHINIKL